MKMKQDCLSRQPYLDLLKSIIEKQKDNSSGYSFAIDGDWGSGKTWILNTLEKILLSEKNNEYLIFHYNAWENDFYEEPLVALLSVMIEKLNEVISQKSLYDAAVDELLQQVSADLLTLVSGIVKEVTKIDVDQIIERKKGFFKRIKQSRKISANGINTLIPLHETLKIVRENILKMSGKVHIILVVDELDRCLPDYAIKVLERLHHVCNEMPVIQIQAINKLKLAESIAKAFGKTFPQNDDYTVHVEQFAELYLQKFVDMILPLPNGILDNKLEILNGLEQSFKPYIRKGYNERDYIIVDETFLISFITSVLSGLNRRLQEKIFKQVELCHKLTLQIKPDFDTEHITYAFLIYEILSCICQFVFHLNKTCRLCLSQENYQLEFFKNSSENKYSGKEYNELNEKLRSFFTKPIRFADKEKRQRIAFEITDTKSYIIAFFCPPEERVYDPLQNSVWQYIDEDREFLDKFDEMMHLLTV